MTDTDNNIPEDLYIYNSLPFIEYSKIKNCKWPCCDKCNVLTLKNKDESSVELKYKLECKKHKKLKKNIYSQEEFDKILRFANYLHGSKYNISTNTNTNTNTNIKYAICPNSHDLNIRSIEKGSRSCDVCNCNIEKNINKVWSCIECGYDVCYKCQVSVRKSKSESKDKQKQCDV
jgi:hypothetical protein